MRSTLHQLQMGADTERGPLLALDTCRLALAVVNPDQLQDWPAFTGRAGFFRSKARRLPSADAVTSLVNLAGDQFPRSFSRIIQIGSRLPLHSLSRSRNMGTLHLCSGTFHSLPGKPSFQLRAHLDRRHLNRLSTVSPSMQKPCTEGMPSSWQILTKGSAP